METEDTPPVSSAGPLTEEQVDESTEEDSLVKESCHDSGIDIRDTSIPPVVPVQTNKKVSSYNKKNRSTIMNFSLFNSTVMQT